MVRVYHGKLIFYQTRAMGFVVSMEKESLTTECPRCKLLETEVASLKAMVESLTKTIKDLTKKLEEATRSKKRLAAPFRKSNSRKKPKDLHRKSGRSAGHPVAFKEIPETVVRVI